MSGSQLSHLIAMINQIAANNAWRDDSEEAAASVATHVRKFWARPMKEQLLGYLEEGGSGLSELSRQALDKLRQ
ncbi:MAG: formate dehydrogenase subunit delta [Gammaproteobacteria bacterium]|nr:formate dehydrogenase subunit delta [Gammaproteobacteria bacterium]